MSIYDHVSELAVTPRRLSNQDATALRHRLIGEAPQSILEICQKSSELTLYLAALLEDQGHGTLTTFHTNTDTASFGINGHLTVSVTHRNGIVQNIAAG